MFGVAKEGLLLKKEAKTFRAFDARWGTATLQGEKVFWFFFSKKNYLLNRQPDDQR
jgi:hypothetical protein